MHLFYPISKYSLYVITHHAALKGKVCTQQFYFTKAIYPLDSQSLASAATGTQREEKV